MKVLVVEDDAKAAGYLKKGLSEEGFVVDIAGDGQAGLDAALGGVYDLMVLDVMLPILDGWTVLKEYRKKNLETPILMLTAHDTVSERVKGLSLGADDYLVKPYAFAELAARVRALLRRNGARAPEVLELDDLTLDSKRGTVLRGEVNIDLTAKEFQLLELFMRHPGEVLSRTYIAESVWEFTHENDSNVVDVSIWRLRTKVDDPYERKFIHTVRGRGYVLR